MIVQQGDSPRTKKNVTNRYSGFRRPGPWPMCSLTLKHKRSAFALNIHALPSSSAASVAANARFMTMPTSVVGDTCIRANSRRF